MKPAFDFLEAFGAILFWVSIATGIALGIPVLYRKLLDHFFPLPERGRMVPRETFEQFTEPITDEDIRVGLGLDGGVER